MNEFRQMYDASQSIVTEQARMELSLLHAAQAQCRCVTPEDMRRMQEEREQGRSISASQTVRVG